MTAYNCKHSGDQFRITKFDDDMEVVSSYLCTEEECDCPAGHRPTCRHRQMLPRFLKRDVVDSNWFFDYDRGGWAQMDIPLDYDDEPEETQPAEPKPPTPPEPEPKPKRVEDGFRRRA